MLLARTYSHHSLLSAVPKIPDLISDAKNKGYTAIALTDEDTGSGLIEFYKECKKQEIKPILGATFKIPNMGSSSLSFGKNSQFSKIAILTKNQQGYLNLLKLISIARTQQEEPAYHLTLANLKELVKNGDNFYVLLGGNDHELITNIAQGKIKEAKDILLAYAEAVTAANVLVELAYPLRNTSFDYNKVNQNLVKIAEELNIRYLASPAPRYLAQDDEETFRVVLAIRNQQRLEDIQLTRDFSLPSKDELTSLYSNQPAALQTEDIESGIDIEIRTNYDENAQEAFFPKFQLDPGQDPATRLRWETYIGLITRLNPDIGDKNLCKQQWPYEKLPGLIEYACNLKPDPEKLLGYATGYWVEGKIKEYIDRVEYELEIIIQKGYAEYFLVFGDIMQFCREQGIVTNTRGSAAGSLVGYLNNINVLDPLMYNLPFERFLNPYRPSPPDIDGDFADDKRELVIKYLKNKYGEDRVSQIITFGTMLPRAAVRDVGRTLGISYKKCDRLAKLIPNAPQGRKTTFKWAFETSSELREAYDNDEESRQIIDISQKIEGNYRHASSHAAGLLIAPTPLTDYVPLQWDTEHKMIVAQYDMKIAEKIGMVKMDILGIRNLAILGNAIKIAEERNSEKIDLLNIDIKDEKAFDLLAKGRTMGTFQLSGATMTRYLVELEPTKVQDLMAMVALYRPGPMGSIPEYIARKRNPKKVKYLVPEMQKWMGESYGLFVYQEDLLFTAIELAGYNWGEVDVLRKGMGKKIQAVIDEQHPKFVQGCVERGLSTEKAEEIWSLMVPFGAYGFNKAHSSSYGMVAYWTAYMKAEYTVEFMTSYMTAESNNLDKIAEAIKECKELGIEVKPPDINKSFDNFTIENNQTIRYGLSSIKNLGSDIISFIIHDRSKSGEFRDMEDFLERMSKFPSFNKRGLEALILSGALDELGSRILENSLHNYYNTQES